MTNKADKVREALQEIINLPAPVGSDKSQYWKAYTRDMQRSARLALHELGEPEK